MFALEDFGGDLGFEMKRFELIWIFLITSARKTLVTGLNFHDKKSNFETAATGADRGGKPYNWLCLLKESLIELEPGAILRIKFERLVTLPAFEIEL